MGAFLVYMLKSAICLIVFFLLFKVLLSRDTFFRFNRFILLGGIMACCLLPGMRLEVSGKAGMICDKIKGFEEIITGESIAGGEDMGQEAPLAVSERKAAGQEVAARSTALNTPWSVIAKEDQEENIVPVGLILSVIYSLGALVVSAGLGLAFIRMAKLLRAGSRKNWGNYVLVLTSERICPFSWGRYIVMNENDYKSTPQEILAHEKVHAEKKHTWDLCLVELLLILQWFNPAIWLVKKELQEIHEYEADNDVINQGIDATQYQLLLVKKAVGARLYSIANSFDHSKLKNRITMMLKEKSNRWARLKVMLLVPPAALLLLAFARPESPSPAVPVNFKITENSGNITRVPEENTPPDTLIQRLEKYFVQEFENKSAVAAKAQYNKTGVSTISRPAEVQYLLMNQKGNILFKQKVVDINKLPAVLTDWKNENLKSKPVCLYMKKDRATPPEDWLKMLKSVKEFYDGAKDDPEFPIKVMVFEPRFQRIEIIAKSTGERQEVVFQTLGQLEKHLNTNDYGKYERVDINFHYTFPDRVKAVDQVKKIIAAKGWKNVRVGTTPPPPPPPLPSRYIIQAVSNDTTKPGVTISGRTCGQLEQRLEYYKTIQPGEKVVLKLDKSLEQKDIDNVRNMLKKHQLEIESEIYFEPGKGSKTQMDHFRIRMTK